MMTFENTHFLMTLPFDSHLFVPFLNRCDKFMPWCKDLSINFTVLYLYKL